MSSVLLYLIVNVHTCVQIELVQGQFPGLAISNAKIQIRFQIIYTEAILSNSTRKLLWFEISKMLIGLLKIYIYCVIYYNFRQKFTFN